LRDPAQSLFKVAGNPIVVKINRDVRAQRAFSSCQEACKMSRKF
jgi:hypothetical protein